MSRWIAVHRPERTDPGTIRVRIETSRELAHYLRTPVFEASYDRPLADVPPSLLAISAIADVAPVCWATGSDLHLACVDATFLRALDELRAKIAEFYPTLPCTTRVFTEEVQENRIQGNGVGLLFSGGVDSTASLVRHRAENPELVMIHGADIPLQNRRLWARALAANRRFAANEGLTLHTVRSNFREVLSSGALDAEFSSALLGRSWWAGIQHGLALLGLLAPLSAASGWRRILIAATHPHHVQGPHGSHPELDSRVRWADLAVVHDSNDLSRYEKIQKVLKSYFEPKPGKPTLRVCLAEAPGSSLNCGRCEKCVRTAVALLLAGIDPRAYGLPYHPGILLQFRDRLVRGQYKFTLGHVLMWQDLQQHLAEAPQRPEPAKFFNWLREVDFTHIHHTWKHRRRAEQEALRRSPALRGVFALRALTRRMLRGVRATAFRLARLVSR